LKFLMILKLPIDQNQQLSFEDLKISQKLEALGELNQKILKADKLIINN